MREKVGLTLVVLMVILQAFYAIYAYVDPTAFSVLRGTDLFNPSDSDWVQIYASRTLFIALIVGLLLYLQMYKVIALVALFGTIMPVTDGWLAYSANAPIKVIVKHIITVLYLLLTACLLLPFAWPKKA